MWAIGVWGGLVGAALLLMRSRYAVTAFGLSLIGAVVGLGYQLFMTQQPASMKTGAMAVMPWVIILICAFLFWYSWSAQKKALLR
jgi:predicted membrane channel-forming protein YqfA (hemolysin III family)